MKLRKIEEKGKYNIFLDENNEEIVLVENKKFGVWVGKNSTSLSNSECFELEEIDGGEIPIFIFKKADLYLNENGYVVYKSKDGIEELFHRMVVFCFADKNGNKQNSKEKTEIDHIDGNKTRNIPENLEIVSPLINKYRAYCHRYNGSEELFFNFLNTDNREEFLKFIKEINREIERGNKC